MSSSEGTVEAAEGMEKLKQGMGKHGENEKPIHAMGKEHGKNLHHHLAEKKEEIEPVPIRRRMFRREEKNPVVQTTSPTPTTEELSTAHQEHQLKPGVKNINKPVKNYHHLLGDVFLNTVRAAVRMESHDSLLVEDIAHRKILVQYIEQFAEFLQTDCRYSRLCLKKNHLVDDDFFEDVHGLGLNGLGLISSTSDPFIPTSRNQMFLDHYLADIVIAAHTATKRHNYFRDQAVLGALCKHGFCHYGAGFTSQVFFLTWVFGVLIAFTYFAYRRRMDRPEVFMFPMLWFPRESLFKVRDDDGRTEVRTEVRVDLGSVQVAVSELLDVIIAEDGRIKDLTQSLSGFVDEEGARGYNDVGVHGNVNLNV